MRRSAQLSVPGAAAGLPAPAPMLSVPIEPAFAAITIRPGDKAAVRNRERARAELPMFTPELLLQVEPAPVTVTVPCEPAPLPMLAAKAVLLMTIPPFVIVSVPVPKLPILSPPPGLLFQVEPGPVTVTVPIEPADNPTEPPPAPLFTVPPFWMVSVPVPMAADHDVCRRSSTWSLRRIRSPCPASPINCQQTRRSRSTSRRFGLRAFLSRFDRR